MDAANTVASSSKEEPVMFSDTTSKTSTEDDDSSGDESSTEQGYRKCIQKYSKYLPGGEQATQEIIRKRSDDEHDDIISKDEDASGGTIERYKQLLTKNHNKGQPDEGDYQPLEIIISKSEEDMRLEADEDFHRWETPDTTAKTPKQTSNVLASEDLNVVNNLLGADSDSDDEHDNVRQDVKNRAGISNVGDRIEGEENGAEMQMGNNTDPKGKVNRSAGNTRNPTVPSRGPGLTSDLLGIEDMEMVNMMLGSDSDSTVDDHEEEIFRSSYPGLTFDDQNGGAGKDSSSAANSTNQRMFDDEIFESHRFIAQDYSQKEIEIGSHSQTRRWGNTTVGYMSDPSVSEESLGGLSERSDRGTSFYPHSDAGESSTMASGHTSSTISPTIVPKQPVLNSAQQEGLKQVVGEDGSSSSRPPPGSEKGTPMNTNSDSGESSIMTSDDSTISISPTPITKPPVPKSQEGLTPIDESATLSSPPNLDEEDAATQLVDDPWNRWMERRDIRIDHMDTDFLCLWSKPASRPMNNVIGNSSFSEDETIQSLQNTSAPMTPVTPDEFLVGSDDENVLESKFLAGENQMKQPNLNLQTRHIQGTPQDRQGSPSDIAPNTRELNPRDGSMMPSNGSDRILDSRYKSSETQLNSMGRSMDTGSAFGQGTSRTGQLSSEGGDGYSHSRSIGGLLHDQNPYTETSSLGTSPSVTVRASGASSARMDQSSEYTHSVVSSNGWESTTSSSVDQDQDLENPGMESDDDGPPLLFSDGDHSFDDEFDPLTGGQPGAMRSHRPAPRSSETTVVRGSRTKKNDSDDLVRERHEIAIGRSSGNNAPKRRTSLAPQERGLSAKTRQIAMVLFISFLLGAGTMWYIWETYLMDDPEVQEEPLAPVPSPGRLTAAPFARTTQTPSWSPSIAQTKSPIEALRDLLVFAWPSLESDFADSSSAQSKALLWLQSSPNVDSYDFQQKIQRFALATFFYSTNGAGWIKRGTWLSETDECEWNLSNSFRPPCNEEGLYVYLEMNSNGVSGSIPSELALLSNSLVRLELSQIGGGAPVITGTIPPELGALTLLQSVDLANNALTGELPNEIGQWTKATAIDLSGNALSSQLPPTIAGLTSLRSLNLRGNSFTLLPRQISGLLSLRNLDVSDNRLGNIPVEIGGLVSLRTLDLSHNQIQSSIPSEIGLLSLRNLDMSHNQIQSSIPSEIGRQSGLVDLDLSNNSLSGSIPSELSSVTLLRNLALHNNGLNGTIPASLGALSRLATFRVEANNLTGIVSQTICNVFNTSVPAFVSDCVVELVCPCCMFCCEDAGDCQCQLGGELAFLCDEYTTNFGISISQLNW